MHGQPVGFIESIAAPLGWYYALACAANIVAAARAWRRAGSRARAALWLAMGSAFAGLAWQAFAGRPLEMPEGLKGAIDGLLGPLTFSFGALATLAVLYLGRRFFATTPAAWAIFCTSLLLVGASMTDPDFTAIVTRPDNVPIVAMVYLLGFFLWLGMAQAVENDRRIAQGLPPAEKDFRQKVLVWPDLVYTELICIVLVSVLLIVWSMVLTAPLEEPANPVVTPNPSKAPWYFVGLQEMLVFFDPWVAGVVLPCLIIFGLMAIPYLDFNPKGDGYYTIDQRRFSYLVFGFGFLQLWILLILIGTFMRGPNWSFFGLYETRDPHKILAASNMRLSTDFFWPVLLGRAAPQVVPGASAPVQLATILWREIAGVGLLLLYFVGLPVLLGRTVMGEFRRRMGFGRFTVMILLLLAMVLLPLKMVLRWTFHLSYIVSIPEYSLNF